MSLQFVILEFELRVSLCGGHIQHGSATYRARSIDLANLRALGHIWSVLLPQVSSEGCLVGHFLALELPQPLVEQGDVIWVVGPKLWGGECYVVADPASLLPLCDVGHPAMLQTESLSKGRSFERQKGEKHEDDEV